MLLLTNTVPAHRQPTLAPVLNLYASSALRFRVLYATRRGTLSGPAWAGSSRLGRPVRGDPLAGPRGAASVGLTSRVFREGEDLRGVPVEQSHRVSQWQVPGEGVVLPAVLRRGVYLDDIYDVFKAFALLDGTRATDFLRAARQYADALWLGDRDPDTACLMLASSLEAAGRGEGDAMSPAQKLMEHKPDLVAVLREHGSEELVGQVATMLEGLTGSTRKFREVVLNHLPPAPDIRGPEAGRLDWSNLKKPIDQAYSYRSRRLHEGTPFPAPLCEPPVQTEAGSFERAPGISSWSGGAQWRGTELPMYLQTFAYIVRGVLLVWLSSTQAWPT